MDRLLTVKRLSYMRLSKIFLEHALEYFGNSVEVCIFGKPM